VIDSERHGYCDGACKRGFVTKLGRVRFDRLTSGYVVESAKSAWHELKVPSWENWNAI
jgi:hypothetical protein